MREQHLGDKDYYSYHGRRLSVVPERVSQHPAKEYLDWLHDHVFFE